MYHINDTVYCMDGDGTITGTATIVDIIPATDNVPTLYICEYPEGGYDGLCDYEIRPIFGEEDEEQELPDQYFDCYFPELEGTLGDIFGAVVHLAMRAVEMEHHLYDQSIIDEYYQGMYGGLSAAIKAITGMKPTDYLEYLEQIQE
jgi:hypothetical protein